MSLDVITLGVLLAKHRKVSLPFLSCYLLRTLPEHTTSHALVTL